MVGEPFFYERTGTGEATADELDAALADAGQYDVLVVLTTSRFARNRAEAIRRKAQFAKAGIPIWFVHDRILSGSRSSRLLEGVREVIDEEENETRRFWIAGGQRERQLAGHWLGTIPYGYRRRMTDLPDGSRRWDGGLEPDETEAAVVRRIFAAVVSGEPMRSIAVRLDADGLRNRAGGPWLRGTVNDMARNPVYAGQLVRYRDRRPSHYYPEDDPHDGRQTIEGAIPPLVDGPLWEAANRLLDEKRIGPGPGPHRKTYPLSRVLRCAACGGRMTGASNGAGTRYYRCSTRANAGTCAAPNIRAARVEGEFAGWLDTLRLPPDWRTKLAQVPERDRDAEDARRERLERRLVQLRKQHSWSEISDEEFKRETTEVRGELALVVRPNLGNLTAMAEALEQVGRTWLADDSPARAVIPALMLRDLVVEGGEISEWVVRAELRPLIELCVLASPSLYSDPARYPLRFSA
jgi:DNA invertase Pin-like site-specific DNA recombinase